jgi:hypothetical protein
LRAHEAFFGLTIVGEVKGIAVKYAPVVLRYGRRKVLAQLPLVFAISRASDLEPAFIPVQRSLFANLKRHAPRGVSAAILRSGWIGLKTAGQRRQGRRRGLTHRGWNGSAQQNSQAQSKHRFHRSPFLKQLIAANFALKLATIRLTRHSFQGDWNCTMSPK